MRLIRKNVEREADGIAAEKLMNDGFKPVENTTSQKTDMKSDEKTAKSIEEMTVEELKALAKERGLTGVSALAKQDLIDILKG
jgi:hypothetical protein